jgi:hypothetical protein
VRHLPEEEDSEQDEGPRVQQAAATRDPADHGRQGAGQGARHRGEGRGGLEPGCVEPVVEGGGHDAENAGGAADAQPQDERARGQRQDRKEEALAEREAAGRERTPRRPRHEGVAPALLDLIQRGRARRQQHHAQQHDQARRPGEFRAQRGRQHEAGAGGHEHEQHDPELGQLRIGAGAPPHAGQRGGARG